MKRLLMDQNITKGMRQVFEQLGYQVFGLQVPLNELSREENCQVIENYYKEKSIEYVFTLDFWPYTSEVCHKLGIKYISWVWDCPHTVLWSQEARHDTNYIFVFDYSQFEKHRARGLDHIFYLPIAADNELFQRVIQNDCGKSRAKYSSDVSFVGRLYNDKEHDLFSQIQYLPPYVSGYLEALMRAQKQIWGADLLENTISNEVWTLLKQYVKWDLEGHFEEGLYEASMKDMIGQKIAQTERKEMCSYLARNFDFSLYTKCDTSYDPVIVSKGYVQYDTQMPLVFHYSKINIHITSRSIPCGVPLRVMDILACEGFLLTNYQPEIAEYFEDGVELVVYTDFQDMYEKIRYYLEHDDEREKIAHAGYLKVKERFNYANQIGIIDEIVS